MRKAIATVVVVAFPAMCAAPVFALPAPIEKLKGGAIDVIKSPLELGKYTHDEMKSKDFILVGFLRGVIMSTAHTIKKAVLGAVDIATFPVDLKK